MKGTQLDLVAIVVLTLLLQPLVYGVPAEPVRVVLGLLLVLFFPGYTLVSSLYPRREQMAGVERVALGLGLSLALVPLIGLALNFTTWGIRLTPIVITLSVWTLVFAAIAWRLRRLIVPEERFEITLAPITAWIQKPRRLVDLALGIALALAVVAVVGALVWKVQQPTPGEAFTEFYVLGSQRMLADYPTDLQVGEVQDYNLGVVNHEKESATFTIQAFLGDTQAGSIGPLALADGQAWDGNIDVTPATTGESQKLEFRLFREPASGVYRTVHLFVDVRAR